MWRAGFGGSPAETEHLAGVGRNRAVSALFRPPNSDAAVAPPDLSALEELEQEAMERIQSQGAPKRDSPEAREFFQRLQRINIQSIAEIAKWWIKQMMSAEDPLLEKMVLFWHNHFTTSVRDVRQARWIYNQHMTLRKNALGDFRQFLLDISRDTAMLEYLDNGRSRKEHPNENYARELMELFTMGEGNYTDKDVVEAARAFTGWTHDRRGNFVVRPFWHDDGEKVFLGRRGHFDGTDIIDIILEQQATAPFIVRKVLRSFVLPEPPEDWVNHFAAIFRRSDYDISPLMKAILEADLMYSGVAFRSQIKSPVEFAVGTLRLMRIDFPRPEVIWGAMGLMGQRLLDPPSVKGWDGGRAWISSATLDVRNEFIRGLVTGEVRRYSPRGEGGGRTIRLPRPPFDPTKLLQANDLSSPDRATDALVSHFLQTELPTEKHRALRDYARSAYQQESDESRAASAVTYLILSLPEYQLC
jgi:uncharacterized protein (DUF1800 family)